MNSQNEQNAYPTDDLEALVKLMNEKQQIAFKQAVVRQTIYYVSKHLPSEANDEGEHSFIAIANQWIENPTEKNADNAMMSVVADSIDGGARYFDYPVYFHNPAIAAGSNTHYAAQTALESAENDSKSAYQWQMTTALAILNNEELPLLP